MTESVFFGRSDGVLTVGGVPADRLAARVGGTVSVIGVLSQGEGLDPRKVLMKTLRVQGIFVGSRRMFEELNRAVTASRLQPVIDRVFPFEQAHEALEHLQSGSHFGKIVIRID